MLSKYHLFQNGVTTSFLSDSQKAAPHKQMAQFLTNIHMILPFSKIFSPLSVFHGTQPNGMISHQDRSTLDLFGTLRSALLHLLNQNAQSTSQTFYKIIPQHISRRDWP
jgi:hypothetical protein